MAQNSSAWTVSSLKNALDSAGPEAGISTHELEGTDVLEVTLAGAGDFVLHVAIGDAQILTSAVLWARDSQENPEGFEAMMLRSHKSLLPLCALSIDTIDGREFYELFGAMSRESSLDDILMEFSSIAQSALELAREIGPGVNTSEDAA